LLHAVARLLLREEIGRGGLIGRQRLAISGLHAVSGLHTVPAGLRLLPAVAVAAFVVRPGGQVGQGDAVLATLVLPDPDGFLVDLGAQHRHRALPGAEHRAHRRQPLYAVAVLGQLVGEAAHEPATGARYLAGVERELLLARHLERDRVEVLEPGRAAE